jgi:thiol:disulfide interchange protein DsbD
MLSIRSAALALLVLLATALGLVAQARADEPFLDPAQAFQLSVRALPDKRVELTYQIAPKYYLYRERFKFSSPDATLGEPQLPAGKRHYDKALEQEVETYRGQVVVVLPVLQAPRSFMIAATHQGCAEAGLCYPPQPRTIDVSLKAFGGGVDSAAVRPVAAEDAGAGPVPGTVVALPQDKPAAGGMSVAPGAASAADAVRSDLLGGGAASAPAADPVTGLPQAAASAVATPAPAPSPAPDDDADGGIGAALAGGHLAAIVAVALVIGLGLAATPCVWPMFPILSSVIVGQGRQVTPARGLGLAAAYALGMALVYTLLGVAAGLVGKGFTDTLQKPAVLLVFGALLVMLATSMFGLYELQLPAAIRDRLSARNDRLSGGQVGGVFGMGVLSALLVSPCVTAPLFSVLLFIAQHQAPVLGGVALFCIALGMSVPLLAIGASAGALLPRSGPWMEQVKRAFGLVLLGVALYVVRSVLPAGVVMVGWGVLAIVGGVVLGAFEPVTSTSHPGTARTVKGLGLVVVLVGALELVGAASGGTDPARPLARLAQARAGGAAADEGPRFDRVASVAELDQRLRSAGRPVMLDFYADWCVSCKEMEQDTFTDPAVAGRLRNAVLLRADVTASTPQDLALLKRFGLFGPPGLIFFDAQGREVEGARVVGFQSPQRFARSLAAAGL